MSNCKNSRALNVVCNSFGVEVPLERQFPETYFQLYNLWNNSIFRAIEARVNRLLFAIDIAYDCRWDVRSGNGREENGRSQLSTYTEYGNKKEEGTLIVDFNFKANFHWENQILNWVFVKVPQIVP